MALWNVQVGDDFGDVIFATLAGRAVTRLPDELDGKERPLRVLKVSAPNGERALDLVCEVLDEHRSEYCYVSIAPAG